MEFRNALILAPLAGITDTTFRLLCRENGADIVVTEMVSAKAIIHNDKKTRNLLAFDPREAPVGVQIFGSDPDEMGKAAGIVGAMGFSFVDLNMGCPARKVTGGGSGSALMADPKKAGRMAAACVSVSPVPVTAKIRSGFGEETDSYLDVAGVLFDAGVAAVTLHPRTRGQMFSGTADWSQIATLKKNFPDRVVIGNGDVKTGGDAARMTAETGCDAVMIGRAALGNPWIFRAARGAMDAAANGAWPPREASRAGTGLAFAGSAPTPEERRRLILRHGEEAYARIGRYGIVEMRKHLAWYSRGIPGAAAFRAELVRVETIDGLRAAVARLF